MELSKINEEFKKLPVEQQEAILKIIDFKTNEDMKDVIQSIKHLENKFDSKITALDSKISTIFWVLGVIVTLIIALKLLNI